MAGRYCVARLAADVAIPPDFFTGEGFVSATRTNDELSLVYPAECSFEVQKQEPDWVGFMVAGPLEFSETGILSRLSGALADAGVSLFAISTFDTDYLFIKMDQKEMALAALAKVAQIPD